MKSGFHHPVTVQKKPPENPLCFPANACIKLLLKLMNIFSNHHHLSALEFSPTVAISP